MKEKEEETELQGTNFMWLALFLLHQAKFETFTSLKMKRKILRRCAEYNHFTGLPVSRWNVGASKSDRSVVGVKLVLSLLACEIEKGRMGLFL